MNNKKYFGVFKSLIFYIITGFGISLTIFANIGVSSFNSLNMSISTFTTIRIGTITTFMNITFSIIYMFMTKFKLKKQYPLQVVSSVCLGYVINFFTYNVLPSNELISYASSVLVFLLGVIIAGFGTGMIVYYGVLTFPIESICKDLSEKYTIKLSVFRYGFDLFFIVASISISYFTNTRIFVREGTIMSFLLLSYSIGSTLRLVEIYQTKK